MVLLEQPAAARRPRVQYVRLRALATLMAAWLAFAGPSAGAGVGVAGGDAHDHDAAVATAWFDLYRTLVQETPGFSPPVAARAFGYAGVTLYESVVPGMPGYRSLAGHLSDLHDLPPSPPGEEHYLPEVANAALAAITRELFGNATPRNLEAVDALEAKLTALHAEAIDATTLVRSARHGLALAVALHAWSADDGGAHGQLRNYAEDYVPPVGPAAWVATPRAAGQPFPALQPYWGDNRPFARTAVTACEPPPPPAYDDAPSSPLYREALEVYDVVRAVTSAERATAQYWSDEGGATATPAGHWIAILSGVITTEERSLAFAAEAYARLGMVMSDAFVSCWDTKYRHTFLRPITYIQRHIDPTWNTPRLTDPLLTPPFPEYTSGHSVLSAAAAQVLTELVGEDYAFVDDVHTSRGFPPRSYASFWEAADEAALSRLYGGVHFRSAIELGVAQGRCVADQHAAIAFRAP